MLNGLVSRFRHLRRLGSGVMLILGAPWTVLGVLMFIRDNLILPENRAAWDTLGLLPHWSASWWIVGALTIILAGVIETSYRLDRALRATRAVLSAHARRMVAPAQFSHLARNRGH